MIEVTQSMMSVLYDIGEKIQGEGWAYTHEWIYHIDEFGNQHRHLGIRFVHYRESFFGFIRHFGSEKYFPLMVFQAEPIPDDKWDGNLDMFGPWAKERGLTAHELTALADVWNGRTEDNPNPLVAVLRNRVADMLLLAEETGYYKKPSSDFFLKARS